MLRCRCPNRRSRRRSGVMSIALALSVVGTPAAAQSAGSAIAGMQMSRGASGILVQPVPAERRDLRANPVLITLASAVLPGSGQLLLGQRRAAAYLALEAIGAGFFFSQTAEGRERRREYRSISRTVARAGFSPDGPRGDWDYYESMQRFVSSGVFDLVPGGEVNPEPDPETFNGAMWLLARRTYWRDPDVPPPAGSPEHAAAMEFYVNRAVAENMRWSWAGEPEAYSRFRAAIDGSNSAFQSAAQTASLVVANHFLSAVDAYVSVRLRLRRHEDGTLYVAGRIPFR